MEGFGPIEQLCALLIVLYLVECLRWVGRGSQLVRSLVPFQWSLAAAWQPAAQWRRGLAMGAPWPPLGALHVMDALPVVLGPKGVTVRVGAVAGTALPSAQSVHVPWSEAKRLSVVDTDILLDGNPVAALGTRRAAAALRALLKEVADARASRREALIVRFLDRRFDFEEVDARRRRWRRWGTPLVVACNLFLCASTAALVVVLLNQHEAYWRVLVVGLAFMWALTATLHDLALVKVLPPEARPPLGRRIVTLLSPMSLMRSADEVRAELYGDLDALAVAARHLQPATLRRGARRLWVEQVFPIVPLDGPGSETAMADDAWLRDRVHARMRRILEKNGVDPEALVVDGLTPDGGSRSYCPRCLAQYVRAEGTCSQCAGVDLRPILTPSSGGAGTQDAAPITGSV